MSIGRNSTVNRTCFFLEVFLFSKDDRSLYFTTIFASVINVFFSSVAIIGNSIILLAIFRTSAVRTCSNLFLGNLVLTDLLVGALVQPLFVVYKVGEILGKYSCLAHVMFSTSAWLCAGVSFLSLTALNCERYVAIFSPLRYKSLVSPKRVLAISACIWILSLLLVSSRFYGLGNAAFYIICCAIIVASLTAFIVISTKIQRVVRRHRRQIAHQQHDRPDRHRQAGEDSNAKSVVWVTLIFVMCYLPTLTIMILYAVIGYSSQIKTIYVWTDTLVFLNSSMNPGIYCWRNQCIRKAVFRLLKITSISNIQPCTGLTNRKATTAVLECSGIEMRTAPSYPCSGNVSKEFVSDKVL